MRRNLYRIIYFYYAALIFLLGLITKFFLVDTDLGARFKNYDHRLLASDIAFICAIILCLVGLCFYLIQKSNQSTLNDATIRISFLLIVPLSLILSITPILETVSPGEVGDGLVGSIFTCCSIIGFLAAFVWIILVVIALLKQLIIITTRRNEKLNTLNKK